MIHVGDCRDILPSLSAGLADAVVTDPPYELGFMGKGWDASGVAFDPRTWIGALHAAKPGAYLAAFGGTRTFHRMACAIEDAGWELRDTLMWLYGSGFPKSHNGPWGGTALKPAWEPIILARKPIVGTVAANHARYGTGGLNTDDCGIGAKFREGGRWPANVLHDGSQAVLDALPNAPGQMADASTDSEARKTKGVFGSMRRGRGKEKSADSPNAGGVGFSMRPGARRLDTGSAARFFYCAKASNSDRNDGLDGFGMHGRGIRSNTSGRRITHREGYDVAARENSHPTVKPTELMRWLCRLVTPPGGLVLDPFTGSGSTGRGASAEGMRFVGIELDPTYAAIADARIRAMQPGLALDHLDCQ